MYQFSGTRGSNEFADAYFSKNLRRFALSFQEADYTLGCGGGVRERRRGRAEYVETLIQDQCLETDLVKLSSDCCCSEAGLEIFPVVKSHYTVSLTPSLTPPFPSQTANTFVERIVWIVSEFQLIGL